MCIIIHDYIILISYLWIMYLFRLFLYIFGQKLFIYTYAEYLSLRHYFENFRDIYWPHVLPYLFHNVLVSTLLSRVDCPAPWPTLGLHDRQSSLPSRWQTIMHVYRLVTIDRTFSGSAVISLVVYKLFLASLFHCRSLYHPFSRWLSLARSFSLVWPLQPMPMKRKA